VCRIEQVLGELDEPLAVYRAPVEHSAGLSLEYPTHDQNIIADRIGQLTEKVRAGLATCQRGALRMACRLDLSAHPPLTLKIGLFAPTSDAKHLCGLILNQLETKKLPSCVTHLAVSVTLSAPLRSAQTSLFDDELYDLHSVSGSAISRLVDSLSGRLGRDAVVGVKLEDDPLPERAFRVSPLAGNRALSRKPESTTSSRSGNDLSSIRSRYSDQPSPDDAMRRPLSLLSEPIPLAVAFENGSFHLNLSSPQLPDRIRLDGVVHLIVAHWGPERIETDWWKGSCIGRDYYRIETNQGHWWWIFRNLVSKSQSAKSSPARYRWMLHGRFD
jgi:protein ImuB